ncbi:outer membrane protein assembly factor BamE domain-containing protein [Vreelandella aquamarina]|uniref:outer membrane protein assembly factor BamE domain-containing protein n=1 Tax=Vreelandella aquamarina TaxID=77097 RepID=UPI001D1958E4|nr:outer membrane protein assembly factor BamE [Halomonas meridiana]MCC4288523.1 outer membrane protein assembly factor BamE [Halomonas meridiana]
MRLLVTMGLVALLAGCASVGNSRLADQNDATIAEQITIGTTTQSEIIQALGSPSSRFLDANGNEQWMYLHSRASADAINFVPFAPLFGTSTSGETKQLTVIFDDEGVVENYLMNTSDTGVKTGVFSD